MDSLISLVATCPVCCLYLQHYIYFQPRVCISHIVDYLLLIFLPTVFVIVYPSSIILFIYDMPISNSRGKLENIYDVSGSPNTKYILL